MPLGGGCAQRDVGVLTVLFQSPVSREVLLAADLEGNFGRGRGLLQHHKAQHCNFSWFCGIRVLLIVSPRVGIEGDSGTMGTTAVTVFVLALICCFIAIASES